MWRWYLAALGLVLLVVVGRVWYSARTELSKARAARTAVERLDRFQWAMRWYLPGTSAPQDAADEITDWAIRAEQQGRPENALAAWRRLRGGILATRHLWSPFDARLPEANRRIATLTADLQLASGAPSIRGRDRATLIQDHFALLQLDAAPRPGWSIAVFFGFLGWVGGAGWTIRRGLTPAGGLVRRPFLRGLAATITCFAIWILGLLNA